MLDEDAVCEETEAEAAISSAAVINNFCMVKNLYLK
jgi:hypothetical protein